MKKLTVDDLIYEGYFSGYADLARKLDVSSNAIRHWRKRNNGAIPDYMAFDVIKAASKLTDKPLKVDMLALKEDMRGKASKANIEKRVKALRDKRIPALSTATRVKGTLLSDYILAMADTGMRDE